MAAVLSLSSAERSAIIVTGIIERCFGNHDIFRVESRRRRTEIDESSYEQTRGVRRTTVSATSPTISADRVVVCLNEQWSRYAPAKARGHGCGSDETPATGRRQTGCDTGRRSKEQNAHIHRDAARGKKPSGRRAFMSRSVKLPTNGAERTPAMRATDSPSKIDGEWPILWPRRQTSGNLGFSASETHQREASEIGAGD